MEKSPEIGSGHNTTYFRELDSRTGRWWSTDPVWHPWQSNYSTFDNNPIALADPSGSTTTGGPKKGKRGENFDPCIEYHAYQAKLARKAKREAKREKAGQALKAVGEWFLSSAGNNNGTGGQTGHSYSNPEATSVAVAEKQAVQTSEKASKKQKRENAREDNVTGTRPRTRLYRYRFEESYTESGTIEAQRTFSEDANKKTNIPQAFFNGWSSEASMEDNIYHPAKFDVKLRNPTNTNLRISIDIESLSNYLPGWFDANYPNKVDAPDTQRDQGRFLHWHVTFIARSRTIFVRVPLASVNGRKRLDWGNAQWDVTRNPRERINKRYQGVFTDEIKLLYERRRQR